MTRQVAAPGIGCPKCGAEAGAYCVNLHERDAVYGPGYLKGRRSHNERLTLIRSTTARPRVSNTSRLLRLLPHLLGVSQSARRTNPKGTSDMP